MLVEFCQSTRAYESGLLQFNPEIELLEQIKRISLLYLSEEQIIKLFKIKFYLASKLNCFDLIEDDAKAFLQKYKDSVDEKSYHNIILARAGAALQKGKTESSQALYKQLLNKKNSIDSNTLAFAYRGMALTLEPKALKSYNYHEMSVDAFLQAGNKIDAAKSLYRMAKLIEFENPSKALESIDEATDLLCVDSFIDRNFLAALLHAKAIILLSLGRYEEASIEISKAIKLRQNLIGCESQLLSSLILEENTSIESQEIFQLNNNLIEKFQPFIQDKNYKLRLRLAETITLADKKKIAKIYEEIESTSDPQLKVVFHTSNALLHPELSYEDKLEELDKALSIIKTYKASNEDWEIVCFTLAEIHLAQKEEISAIEWYQKTLEYNPLNYHAGQNLAGLLWKNEMWEAAVLFFEDQRKRFGDLPGILYGYGQSLLEAGRANDAVQHLFKATQAAQESSNSHIKECYKRAYERAMNIATKVNSEQEETQLLSKRTISYRLLEERLNEFVKFIQSELRMKFWGYTQGKDEEGSKKRRKKERDWISNPERFAQSVLSTFLNASFDDDIKIFEELSTGAGRIDIFLEFVSGLKTVIELKMCGEGYSKNYALEGLDQLVHYLDNKNTFRGYLIVFDGRINDFGKGFPEIKPLGKYTISIFPIDVRHTISKLKS